MRKALNDYEKNLIHELGRSIRSFRKEQNISQDLLSEISGIDRRSISDIENGKNNLSFITLYKIVKSLHMPSDLLFYPREEMDSPALQRILIEIMDCREAERETIARYLVFLVSELRRNNDLI